MTRTLTIVSALFSITLAAACGKGGDAVADKPAPAKPATGAPVALEVTAIGKDSVEIDAYDFSDKAVAGYGFLFRYHDKDGKILKVKSGTPFESEIDHMSVSGRRFKVEAGTWGHFTIDHLSVPEGAVKADALVDMVRWTDGTKVEDLWSLPPGNPDQWPAK
ncbi:MAG: hypothetical protein K8W52_17385 [Deltaproteobacteria bacterium]|nr:hypothetical protein [Deltaproteobacteria bacterium]